MRVLIAEDDRSVANALTAALSRAGHACTRVRSGEEVIEQHADADAVLLDLGLEGMNGLDALRELRATSDVPVLVVTARGDERSTVQALRLGADDYLVKPVRLHELLARLAAVARRYRPTEADVVKVGEVAIDVAARQVLHAGSAIALTPTEFQLITLLARRVGMAVGRQELIDQIWSNGAPSSRSFDVHLAQLRQKLPILTITTIRGFGFRLEEPS